jgi:hypothetical protein
VSLERYSIIGLLFSATIILLDLYLLKKRKIDTSTFARWFILGLAIGTVSVVPAFFALLYMALGTEVLISAVTVTSFMVLLLMIFYLDYKLNDLNDKLMKLTAELSARKFNLMKEKDEK